MLKGGKVNYSAKLITNDLFYVTFPTKLEKEKKKKEEA